MEERWTVLYGFDESDNSVKLHVGAFPWLFLLLIHFSKYVTVKGKTVTVYSTVAWQERFSSSLPTSD